MAWAQNRYGIEGGDGMIQQGDCASARLKSLLLHLLINTFSSILLTASSAFVQAFSSPSRAEVDVAHQRGQWLHIGTLSWRNLLGISRKKVAVCIFLLLSSIPFHLLHNSLVFVSVSMSYYMVVGVTPYFIDELHWDPLDRLAYLQDLPGEWERLEPVQCIEAYSDSFQNTKRHVFLVTSTANYSNSVFLENSDYASVTDRSFSWMCSEGETGGQRGVCSPEELLQALGNGGQWHVNGRPTSHCLAEHVEAQCAVVFHHGIMVAVLVINGIMLLAMLYVIDRFNAEHLLDTVGDAVMSFLGNQDSTTWHMCLATRLDFEKPGFHETARKTIQQQAAEMGSWRYKETLDRIH
ncbi:hypothetical protein S7711_01700 [Stachybotrys chartarum IBT 7711]|uniref:DUF6536 domain-containing protein n=1 Tax=Stachybotrys chartarum (strain CBS 109288 / IBT 7711) TaxID=1280523 RepID=A0A084AVB6_STACB|nr:hypothetical protein S7711_01700 [Stachybotrys chartarum IBT 7711]